MQDLQVKFNIKGIDRKTPYTDADREDGWCDELINFRHDNGRLEPVGTKPKLYNLPLNPFNKIWIHSQDNIHNFIGYNAIDQSIYLVNMANGASTLIHSGYIGPVRVEFVKTFMIVIHANGMDTFWWNDNQYKIIIIPEKAQIMYTVKDTKAIKTGETLTAEGVLGKYYKALNEQSADGFHTGGIMLRSAFRMFDGSYILHSVPEYLKLGLTMYITEKSINDGGETNDLNAIKFYVSKIQAGYNKVHYAGIDSNLFTHIVIFACKNEELYDISVDTITDELLLNGLKGRDDRTIEYNFGQIDELKNQISNDFKNMADSASWYKIHEISIDDMQSSDSGPVFVDIDMKDFYKDYATREVLTVDQFSHHKIYGAVSYNYNSRLILGNISTRFGSYQYYPLNPAYLGIVDEIFYTNAGTRLTGLTIIASRQVKFAVTLNTSSGKMLKVFDAGPRPFATDGSKEYLILSKNVFGYPDARAEKVEILVEQGGVWHKMHEVKLTKSQYGNFAYYFEDNFSGLADNVESTSYNFPLVFASTDYPASSIINIYEYTDSSFSDQNRVQLSEVKNPLYFPSDNSYQVGTGVVTDIAANTEPLTEGPFGEHPLQVFTSKGRYIMIQGIGSVQFSQVVPMSGDVAIPGSVVSVALGVVFATQKGLFLTNGRLSKEISEVLTGEVNTEFKNNPNYQYFLTDIRLVNIVNYLSSVNAKEYLAGADVGYDQENKELICSNPNYSYSYVFSFESNSWYKLDTSFKFLINNYPKLYGLREGGSNPGVFNLSDEVYFNPMPALISTQPLQLGSPEIFKVIQRLRFNTICEAKEGTHAGFYLFGSSNLIDWQFITGRNHLTGKIKNILLTRSGNKWKYYTVVIAGDFKPHSNISTITASYQTKMDNKPR